MNHRRTSPTLRRRRLAREMRALREKAGLKLHEASALAGMIPAKLSRIENGMVVRPSVNDIGLLADAYEADAPTRESLVELTHDACKRGWWELFKDLHGRVPLPAFEAETSAMRLYAAQSAPELFRTPDYAAAVLIADPSISESDVERFIEAHEMRRRLIDEIHPPHITAVIDEAVLHRPIGGPAVMREQLEHLGHLAVRHNIEIRVLPFLAGEHTALEGAFTILHFPDPSDLSIVHVRSANSSLHLETEEDLAAYDTIFVRLEQVALSGEQSAELIAEAAERWSRPGAAG